MSWEDLRELRERGQRPALPVCVTTDFWRCRDRAEAGALVIVHKAGERFEAQLLDGLEVELFLDGCAQTSAVARLIREREVAPASVVAWCKCWGELGSFWNRDCSTGAETLKAWDALCAR